MKMLPKISIILAVLGLMTFVACEKEGVATSEQTKTTPNVQALVASDGFVYDYDKYGTMVYNHASYFNGTFDPSLYLPTEAGLRFKNEFPAFCAQQESLYPTLQSALTAYVQEGIYTENGKNVILDHLREITDYLNSSNSLSYEDINTFILNKESVILLRMDLNDREKMSVLPLSSITRNFIKLTYEEHIAFQLSGAAQSRGDCTWYKIPECILKLYKTYTNATAFALTGAKIGVSIGFIGGPAGVTAGAIIGGALGATVGVAVNLSGLKSCKEACIDGNAPPPTTPVDPCKGATDLAIKINGCSLTQEFVATGQGTSANIFQGPVLGATVNNIISTVPNFFLTQSDPNIPITIALLSGCVNTPLDAMGQKIFNIASIVGDPGFVDILGARRGCLEDGDGYDIGGSSFNNPNNTVVWNIPGGDYTYSQSGNKVFFSWNAPGTYTFSATVTNACSGASSTQSITVNVVSGVCE